MKSVLSIARAAALAHRSLLSASSSTGISQHVQLDEQRRGLLDHPAYFMETLQISVNEATALCGIDFLALSLPFEDATDTTTTTDSTLLTFDFLALVQHYANLFPATCSATNEHTFRMALDEFETCSSFDIEGVLENLGDAFIGSIMECVTSVVPLLQTMEALSDLDFPEQCENALLGKNPIGDMIRNTILFPNKILSCFTELSESVPSCTVEVWPVPLVGPILRQGTCFIGQLKTFLTRLGEHNLDLLDVCLPEIDVDEDEGTDTGIGPPPSFNCDSYCSNFMGTEVMMNFPFSDLSQSLAKQQGLDDVIPRFEEFAAQCLSQPWEGWSYASNDYYVASVKLYPDPNDATVDASSPSSDEDNNDAEQEGSDNDTSASSSSTTDNDSDDGDRFSSGVAAGFIMGLFAAAIMWAVVKCCQRIMQKQPEEDPKNTTFESKEPDDTGSSDDSDSEEPDMYEDITYTIT